MWYGAEHMLTCNFITLYDHHFAMYRFFKRLWTNIRARLVVSSLTSELTSNSVEERQRARWAGQSSSEEYQSIMHTDLFSWRWNVMSQSLIILVNPYLIRHARLQCPLFCLFAHGHGWWSRCSALHSTTLIGSVDWKPYQSRPQLLA